jgi:hypothetical protein
VTDEIIELGACSVCGLDAPAMRAALVRRDERIEALREDVANAERELRGKRAQIKRLKADHDTRLRSHPLYPTAMDVLAHWRDFLMPTARELHGSRLENCIARLQGDSKNSPTGYTPEQLKRSIDGYALKPFVVGGKRVHEGPKDAWAADAELIFRDARHVDQGLRIADEADRLRGAVVSSSPPAEDSLVSPIGQAALRFARKGFYVFPCRPKDKRPATRHGLHDATRDRDRIVVAWSKHPFLNVAIRTGVESGIVVLDVDGDDGWDSLHELEDRHSDLPTTASVTTPRGGQHFWFAHPGVEVKNSAGLLGPGLDVRGDGGYVLAPPSVGADGNCYEVDEQAPVAPLPNWLRVELVQRQEKLDTALGNGELETFMRTGASKGNRNDRVLAYHRPLGPRHVSAVRASSLRRVAGRRRNAASGVQQLHVRSAPMTTYNPACFLASYGVYERGPMPACDGRLVRCHLVPRQKLRQLWGAVHHGRLVARPDLPFKTLEDMLNDRRSFVLGCGGPHGNSGHHGMLDQARTLRIPRAAIPEATEEFAAIVGLDWWLDVEYDGVRR